MRGAVITGWGVALPDTVVGNDEIARNIDSSNEWIVERTGIRERRIGGTTSGLAVAAARQALTSAGVAAADIDLLVLATTTPDQRVPATSAVVQHALGLRCGAFDLNAACAGFVYALVAAHGFVAMGADRVLLVGSETLSTITDPFDRGSAFLFADGAGAVVLEATPGDGQLLGWDLGCDGSAQPILHCDHGGTIYMEGREVFRRAVRATVDSALAALERAKVRAGDIALFVPHQANIRIMESAANRLGIPTERMAVVIDRTGNTSAASIPIALAEAADTGRLRPGDLVLLSGFGAGMTWASAVLRWGAGR
ncbi:MAG: 3-oxoacyl-ACP synthase [Acidimicrobiia bacterium]